MRQVRALVFDIDDTLYLERDYIKSGFNAVGIWGKVTLGLPNLAERFWSIFLSGARGNIFDLALREIDVDPRSGYALQLRTVYRTHTPDIALAPDAAQYLEQVSGTALMSAVTDGPLESQRAKAEALDLTSWLDPIVFTEELGAAFRKPSPRAFKVLQVRIRCESNSCMYVADNPAKDFAGPAGLGWLTCRVRRPGGLHEQMPSGPDVTLEVADLLELRQEVDLVPRLDTTIADS